MDIMSIVPIVIIFIAGVMMLELGKHLESKSLMVSGGAIVVLAIISTLFIGKLNIWCQTYS